MTEQQVAKVIEAFILLRVYYEQPPLDPMMIKAYGDDVRDLPFQEVHDALKRMRRDPRRQKAPRPAELRATIKPEVVSQETEAQAIAGRVGKAITLYGYMQPTKARNFIGEIGWRICEERGGWRHLCGTLEAGQMTAFYAQCRDAARAKLELGMHDVHENSQPALPRKKDGSCSIAPMPVSQLISTWVDGTKRTL